MKDPAGIQNRAIKAFGNWTDFLPYFLYVLPVFYGKLFRPKVIGLKKCDPRWRLAGKQVCDAARGKNTRKNEFCFLGEKENFLDKRKWSVLENERLLVHHLWP